ncbi:MAG: hypothetical protein OXB88_01140 [Bacteriovoracales bacterium]|nr:hypothetical protein [Bacteriovoracales bacterium]
MKDKESFKDIIEIYAKLESVLDKFRKMGLSNFEHITIESDKNGLIYQIRTLDSGEDS